MTYEACCKNVNDDKILDAKHHQATVFFFVNALSDICFIQLHFVIPSFDIKY